jgi:hypothetical protein
MVLVVTSGKLSNITTVVGECATVLCRLLETVQANEDPIVLFRTLEWVFKRFGSPESNGNSPLSLTSTSKRSSGFTCCVAGCLTNNKINPEPSFYNSPSGKSAGI